MRARATIRRFLPSWMIGLPNASRVEARLTIRSSARSAWPIERMQWWMRPGSEAHLRDLEAAAFAEQDVLLRHPHVVERRCMWPCGASSWPNTCHRADDGRRPGEVDRHQDLRLAELGRRRVGAGLDHEDHDLAARVAGAGDVVLLAVDHPLVADQLGAAGDVLGVGGGHVRLGHAEGGADLAVQQRLQPLFLLLVRADLLQHFHVAGVGGRAVHATPTPAAACRVRRRCRRSRGW